MDIKEKILNLINKIEFYNYEYYNLDNPSISDYDYDAILNQLKELEKKYPEYIFTFSPTQRVGTVPISKFKKVNHKFKMLSLDNAFNEEDLEKFHSDTKKVSGNNINEYVLEPKIDGLSISLIYKEGQFYKAVTRGNGIIGEDVTLNIKTIPTIPLRIKDHSEYFEVRGEVYISFSDFNTINAKNISLGKEVLMNPRNAASGSVRNLDPRVAKERRLSVFLYNIPHKVDGINNHWDSLIYLKDLGFSTPLNFSKKFNDFDELKKNVMNFNKDILDFPIDGLVIKVNNYNLYDKLGYTSKFPKWAIAFKFNAEISATKLIGIFPTVGRTGKITYNANLVPVEINQTIVKSATLHNYKYIIDNDIRVGDVVNVYKAGEIIPKVIGPVLPRNEMVQKWKVINECPSCQSTLEFNDSLNEQYCKNIECDAIRIQKIVHFSSKEALNIEGLGESIIERLYKMGLIKSIKDIYNLHERRDEIIKMERMGEKSVNNLLKSIEYTKNVELEKWLFAIGIPNLGKKAAKVLANTFISLDKIKSVSLQELESINDFGPIISKSIYDFFKDDSNIELINYFISLGFKDKVEINLTQYDSILNGKNILITGTFSWISRDALIERAEKEYGAKALTSKSKKVDFLLLGDNAGSKKDWAIKNNITIIDSDKLFSIFNIQK